MPKSKKAKAKAGPGASGPCLTCGKAGAHEYVRVAEDRLKGPYCARHAAEVGRK